MSGALKNKLCNLCGRPLDRAAFVGDEESIRDRDFQEPPGHVDCMRFALKVCPRLNGSRRVRAALADRRESRQVLRGAEWSPQSIMLTRNYWRTDF